MPRGGEPEVDGGRRGREGGLPGLARHAPDRPEPDLLRLPRAHVAPPRGDGRAHHARPRQDVSRRARRGVARHRDGRVRLRPAGPPRRPEHAQRLDERRRVHPSRRRSGVTAAITPFNFPAMVPMWIYPIAIACGNTIVWKPSIAHARCDPAPGRALEGGRPARRRLQHRVRRPRGGHRDRGAPGHQGDPVRRLDAGRAATSTRPARSSASASGRTPPPRTR